MLESAAMPPPKDLPSPGIKPRSSALQVDCLPSELPGESMKTGVGSLFLCPEELPDPGIKLGSPALQADFLPAELPRKPHVRLREHNACRSTIYLNDLGLGFLL